MGRISGLYLAFWGLRFLEFASKPLYHGGLWKVPLFSPTAVLLSLGDFDAPKWAVSRRAMPLKRHFQKEACPYYALLRKGDAAKRGLGLASIAHHTV